MKKFFEGIKDILYDSIDYIIIIGIVGVVVFIISWRLDLLFANDAINLPPKKDIVIEDTERPKDNVQDEKEVEDELDDVSEDDDTIVDHGDDETQEPSNNSIVKITIPAGSLPSKIASILEEHGLISSRAEFIQKSQEMNLDTKLKSGKYEIKAGSSIEEIVKLIAK